MESDEAGEPEMVSFGVRPERWGASTGLAV